MRICPRKVVTLCILSTVGVFVYILLKDSHDKNMNSEFFSTLFNTLSDEHRNTFRTKPVSPETLKLLKLWPGIETIETDDRITQQLSYAGTVTSGAPEWKVILLPLYIPVDTAPGTEVFDKDQCLINTCKLTTNTTRWRQADAVIFHGPSFGDSESGSIEKLPHQIWIFFSLEAPINTPPVGKDLQEKINWTATYRSDSTIVTPYAKFVPYTNISKHSTINLKDYSKDKTLKIAWMVSNCHGQNARNVYVQNLRLHIKVDIYGKCGNATCGKTKTCFEMLQKKYKFYLAFENSNCEHYITEKFFINSLM